jgi:hypothetical protein
MIKARWNGLDHFGVRWPGRTGGRYLRGQSRCNRPLCQRHHPEEILAH